MPENGSVGEISLDLVISAQLEKQLEKIRSAVEKPAEKIGEAIDSAISGQLDDIGNTVEKVLSNSVGKAESAAGKITEKLGDIKVPEIEIAVDIDDNGIEGALERVNERAAQVMDYSVPSEPRVVELGGYAQYDSLKIEEEIQEATEKAEEPLEELKEKVVGITDEIRERLGNFEIKSNPTERLNQQLENTKDKMQLLQKKWQELSYGLENADNAEEAGKLEEQLNAVEKQMIALQSSAEKTEQQLSEMTVRPTDKLRTVASKAGKVVKNVLGGAFKGLKNVGSKAVGAISTKLSGVKDKIKGLLNPVSKLGKNIKSAFKSAFLMAGLYAGFRAIKDGLLEAAQADEQFAKSLNEVKANLSIAFTPIVQAVMPMINSLMSGLASVTKSVAGFISGLFGTTYKQAAEATKKLKGVSDSAKKAKMSTAGIDEMNILAGNDSESESEKGTDYSALDMSEPELPDWAERLKESMKKGDWSGVSSILAERVNSAISFVDWGSLGGKLATGINTVFGVVHTFFSKVNWNNIGKGITKGLNQVVKKTNWKQIGKTFASYIQSIFDVAYNFVTGFDWAKFGASVGESLNAWFEGIDFGRAGETISGGITGLLDTILNFIETVNWREIGSKIAQFVAGIDWSGIAHKAFKLLGSALGAAVTSVVTIISKLGKMISDNFKDGFFNGILKTFSQIGKWIKDNIFTPFIEGFKKVFDIHSPSGVMEEMGEFIVEGLCNAVANGIAKVREGFEKMLEKIKSVFSNIGSWFSEKFSGAWTEIKNAFSGVKTWFSDRWTDIKNVFSGIGTWFSQKFQTAYDNVTRIFSGLGGFFTGLWESISNGAKNGINWIIDKINGLVSAVESAVNFIIDGLNNALSINIPSQVPVIGGTSFSLGLPRVDIPEVPRLANGGLATAPTLSMVGDNRNASIDPEVISPLSKIKGMLSEENSEIVELLRIIVELLKNGISIELINYLFRDSREFSREVIKVISTEKARRGGEAF